MRVVIVSEYCCFPANSGNRLRTLNLMLPLAENHEITYVCRGNSDDELNRDTKRFFQSHGIQARIVPDLPRPSRLRFGAQLAANFFSPRPFAVDSHNSQGVCKLLRTIADQEPVDLWHLHWLSYADAAQALPGCKVYEAHDVTSQIWQRHHETARNPFSRWLIKQQWDKMRRYEGRIANQVDRVVAVSQNDADLFRQEFGTGYVSVVENGVDYDAYSSVERNCRKPLILYVGDLASRPNQDAARLLLDHIFPRVKQSLSEARLSLVGRNPPNWMQHRAQSIDGVQLHANVPDLLKYFSESAVLAVPLRIGGGSRIKILESLAAGLPVVSTRVGAEGLRLQPDKDLLVVDSVEDMADALVYALQNPDAMNAMAENGRRVVQATYVWKNLAEQMGQVWQQCISEKREATDNSRHVSQTA